MKFLTLIKMKGYTCVSLAKNLGVSRQSIYYWACCKSTPNPKTILQIAKILNVSAEEILLCFIKE